jgi:hypothetical protein
MADASVHAEKKCPLCGRGLGRTHGIEIACVLCVRFGPPSVRCKRPALSQAAIHLKAAVEISSDEEGGNESEML